MLNIAICDDEETQVNIHKKLIEDYMQKRKLTYNILTYTRSQNLFSDIVERKIYFDLIVLDIEIPRIDGMTLTSRIKEVLPDSFNVLVTSYLKYAIDAFELEVFRYIPKNLLTEKLEKTLDDVIKRINLQSEQSYIIQTATRMEKILYKNIVYIQKDGKNSIFVMKDGKQTKVRQSLIKVYDELFSEDFVYVDRGTIINVSQIMNIKKDTVQLLDGVVFKTNMSRLEEIKSQLNRF